MSLEVTLDNPVYPKGTEFDLGGLLVKNGETLELTDEQEQSFVSRHQKSVRSQLSNHQHITVKGKGKLSDEKIEELYPEPEPLEITPPDFDDNAEGGEES
jgi:hypothetical protein